MADFQIPVGDITKRMTVKVRVVGYRGWLIRLWVARVLIFFACLIAGVGYEFVEAAPDDDE